MPKISRITLVKCLCLENVYWSTDPWKRGRNKFLLCHLAKHSPTSNTLNTEYDKRKAIRMLSKIQNLPLTVGRYSR
jgi:hypothetical protein